MAKKKVELTAGRAALNQSFRKTAHVFDPTYGDIHALLGEIESATEKIRRRLIALARERKTSNS